MTKAGLRFLAASFCIALSHASYGITSICSGEFLPLTGQYTLQHEARWSYYDNWFFDMDAEVHTKIEGAGTVEFSEDYVMSGGGSVLHYLEAPANGDYVLSGYLRTGYPRSWGFDGYFGVACPPWTGVIANDPSADAGLAAGAEDAAVIGVLALVDASLMSPAGTNATPEAAKDVAGATANPAAPDEVNPAITLSTSVTGVVQSVGPEALVLITDAGRYVTLTLPAKLDITRHTYVNLDEIAPGSVVGAVLGKSAKNETEVVHFRLYRNVSKESALAKEPPITDRPGFEIRGVLKAIARGAQGKNMRLTHAKGEADWPA